MPSLRRAGAAPRLALVIFAVLVFVPIGCGPKAIPPDQAAAIPVHNPSPDNPLKDVNMQNEYQFKDKIGGMSTAK
jgi:hypothetical protein